jgi:hypothetical protein
VINVHAVYDVKQMDTNPPESLVPESSFVEMVTAILKIEKV